MILADNARAHNTMFHIADLKFNVAEASLACLPCAGGTRWALSIQAAPKDIDGERWGPRAYSERLIGLGHLGESQVKNISGLSLAWGDCYDASRGIPHASLYVFEHADIYDSTITFGAFDGALFDFEWKAKCDVFWDEKYKQGLSLHIKTKIRWSRAGQLNSSQSPQ
jgi:hypothetical protein